MEELNDYLGDRYTPQTVKAYQKEIGNYLGNCPRAEKADFREVFDHIGRLRRRYPNARTIRRIVCAIKVYYQYLVISGKRSDNPAASIRLRDQVNNDIQLQDLFSPSELDQLLHKKERYPTLSERNRVLMSLLIHQALQPRELSHVLTGDIDLAGGTIRIRAQPGTNSRTLSLKATQVLLLLNYLQVTRKRLLHGKESDLLLIGLRGGPVTWQDISKHVIAHYKGLFHPRKVNCRTIRASVIANLLKAGNELRAVQAFAGHMKIGTTEKYKQSQIEILHSIIQARHPMK